MSSMRKEWESKATKFAAVYEDGVRKDLRRLRVDDIDVLLDWLDCEQLIVMRNMPLATVEQFAEQRGMGIAIEVLIARLQAVRAELTRPAKEGDDDD